MFIDASAIIAILAREPDRDRLLDILEARVDRETSVLAVWEAVAGLSRKTTMPIDMARHAVLDFLAKARVQVTPLTLEHLAPSLDAFERYGRHQCPEADRNKALNLGDCFHYACARLAGTDILHKDIGLAATDLPSA